eukprot:1147587-Lingulodinium_polyedra.AAC.1
MALPAILRTDVAERTFESRRFCHWQASMPAAAATAGKHGTPWRSKCSFAVAMRASPWWWSLVV